MRWLILFTGLACTFAPQARAADAVKVGQSIAACFCFLPVRVAEQTGVWKQQNLSVELLILRGDAQLQQALASGGIDIGVGSGPAIGLLSKGVPAKAVAATANSLADMGLILPASAPTDLKDLKGERLGVSSAGSLTYWLSRKLAQHEGWEPTAIIPVSLGDLDANVAAMNGGAVNGFIFGVEAGYLLGDRGTGKLAITFDKIVPRFISHAMFASDAMIKDRADVVRRFIAGWFQTVAWMQAHRDDTIKIATDVTKLPQDVAARTYDTVMPTMSADGTFDPEALKILATSFVELGMLPTEIDPATEINASFLPATK